LINAGADVNLRDKEGLTPLDLAKGVRWQPQPAPTPVSAFGPVSPRILKRATSPGSPERMEAPDLVSLLRQHGALDDLPKGDRIEVKRPSASYSAVVFWKGTNDWNQFSLLELIACQYNLLSPEPSPKTQLVEQLPSRFWKTVACKFPDFNRVLIRRPVSTGAGRTNIPVRVGDMLNAGDASPDVRLQWGDTVEIPEVDHPVNQTWPGLPQSELTNLIARVSRQLTIAIKGTNTMLKLAPKYLPTSSFGAYGEEVHYIRQPSCMILPVLQQSELLRASSDLSRVKVSRRDSATGKIQEWTLDCGNSNSSPDLWLRDGDMIEVPDKP
jgi:hypothetical protein